VAKHEQEWEGRSRYEKEGAGLVRGMCGKERTCVGRKEEV
jgi:hypothetical protein